MRTSLAAIALGRKNHLFVGSEQGGHDAAVFYSLIESCKSAGAEPMAYFQDILRRVGSISPSKLATLTPSRWKAERDAAAANSTTPSPPSDSAN